jgi:poly-beta-1,6-N-acetyl-D-glucosamine N-deacetylase
VNTRPYRNAAGWLLASGIRLSGALRRADLSSRQSHSTTALFFHNPSREQFTSVIGWFRDRGYRFLSLEELEDHLLNGKTLPQASVYISLDDAYRSNLTEVLPVVKDWNLPVTIFVPVDEVLRGAFWFSHGLEHPESLPKPFQRNPRQLWYVPNETRRAIIDDLFRLVPPREREVMSAEEVAEISKLPQVSIGSHSMTHAILPMCTREELFTEICDSKRILEEWTGRPVRAFCYPNGDYDPRAGTALVQAGYSLAFTTEPRPIALTDQRYYLPRCSIMDDGSLTENLCHAFGLWSPIIQVVRVTERYLGTSFARTARGSIE